MPEPLRRVIVPPTEFASPEIGVYFAEFESQTERLTADTRGATVEELAWQSAPGMNTIGMLLAHIAIVEVWWMSILMSQEFEPERVLGIGAADDGIPMPDDAAAPPAALA